MTASVNWRIAALAFMLLIGVAVLAVGFVAFTQTEPALQTSPIHIRPTYSGEIVYTVPCRPKSTDSIGPVPEGVYQGQFVESTGLYLLIGDTWSACVEAKYVVSQQPDLPQTQAEPQSQPNVQTIKRVVVSDVFRDWVSTWSETNVTLLRFKKAYLGGNNFPLVALIFVNLGILYIFISSCKEESQEGRYHVISYLILFLVIVNLYPILQLTGQKFFPTSFGWAAIGKQDQLWFSWGTGSWVLSAVALAILVFLAFQIIRDTQHTQFPSGSWKEVLVADDDHLGDLKSGSIMFRPDNPPELDPRSSETPVIKNPATGQEVKAKFRVEVMEPNFRFDSSATSSMLVAALAALATWGVLPFLGFNRIFDPSSGWNLINFLVIAGVLTTLVIMGYEIYFETRYMRKAAFFALASLNLVFLPITLPLLTAPGLVTLANVLGGAETTGKEAAAKGQAVASFSIVCYLVALFVFGFVAIYPASLVFGSTVKPPLFQAYADWIGGFLGR